jgi:hypothetical protein
MVNSHKNIDSMHPLISRLRWAICLVISISCSGTAAQTRNGFDLSRSSIDPAAILSGGPPRDGIPAIDRPQFVTTHQVDFLRDDDIVIGLVRGDTARAYPLRILVWHEVVNDVIGDTPVAVTYCPLCGTGMVFDRQTGETERTFGVSGLLYQSNVLLYDRESESLWSQLAMRAVSGSAVGQELAWLPSEHLTWRAWRKNHPDGDVLSTETGFDRDYGGAAYASYFAAGTPMFPVPQTRQELPNMTWVIGVIVNGQPKAYPVKELSAGGPIEDRVGGKPIVVRYNAESRHPEITGSQGEQIPSVMVFWFAWQAFYPGTELWITRGGYQ